MLNHKFSIIESIDQNTLIVKFDKNTTIRISNKFMEKMKNDLIKYTFVWDGYKNRKNGLNYGVTILDNQDIKNIKKCLLKQFSDEKEKEYNKLLIFIDHAISANKDVIYESGSPSSLKHKFILCTKIPSLIKSSEYKERLIKIHDQFIRENLCVFTKVRLFWNSLNNYDEGFNYYGITIITPKMAQDLLNVMEEFLKNNDSEEAEYFVGEEYDMLREILNDAINENEYVIHFGI